MKNKKKRKIIQNRIFFLLINWLYITKNQIEQKKKRKKNQNFSLRFLHQILSIDLLFCFSLLLALHYLYVYTYTLIICHIRSEPMKTTNRMSFLPYRVPQLSCFFASSHVCIRRRSMMFAWLQFAHRHQYPIHARKCAW